MEQHLIFNGFLACLLLSSSYHCYSIQPPEPSTLHHHLLAISHHLLLPYPITSTSIETGNTTTEWEVAAVASVATTREQQKGAAG